MSELIKVGLLFKYTYDNIKCQNTSYLWKRPEAVYRTCALEKDKQFIVLFIN